MKYKKISIYGMTCSSCEILLTNELKKLPSVHDVQISLSDSSAKVFYKNDLPNIKLLEDTIQKLGYSTNPQEKLKKKLPSARELFIGLGIFLAILFIVKILNLERFFQVSSDLSNNVQFTTVFLIGVAASLSTCLAVVGSVVLSFGTQLGNAPSLRDKLRPHIKFQTGRLLGFFLLGGILGLIGDWFQLSESFFGILSIILSIVILVLGLQTIGISIPLSRFGIRPSKKVLSLWERFQSSQSNFAPFVLGILTFFLPCGFTQSIQLFALSSGNFLEGGLALLFFALGTLPVLLLLGLTSTHIQNSTSKVLKIAIGFFLVLFAYLTFITGTTIVRSSFTTTSLASDLSTTSTISDSSDSQTIEMHVKYSGFSPSTLTVQKGVPVTWIIYGDEVSGCTNEIVIPNLGIRKKIKDGKNIIKFTPENAGTIDYSCWMGMVRGKIKVTP